jgi:hypothetical protein
MKTLKQQLEESLMSVCLIYSDFKNEKRRENFGKQLFELIKTNNNIYDCPENHIIYKGAQWGGKWGNFYKAIYFQDGAFHFGSGFTDKQILRKY